MCKILIVSKLNAKGLVKIMPGEGWQAIRK